MIRKLSLLFITFFFLSACQFPADPDKTLEKIEMIKKMKVGWCGGPFDELVLKEKDLINALSQTLDATVTWESDLQEVLFEKLEENKLQVVVCRIKENSPWKDKLAFTTPFFIHKKEKFVLALPPGENAWLKYVNEFIVQFKEKNDQYF
ncbi:Uncharacterised protein [Legionella adelaidensis]|uniref:Lipoprotein n=1 Tax=Legionella adelaidensis TaxID=45056 RepID=A0A0W0R698_9GAMM|nr:hypothetical protein [Legionella adelaidensis]KTC66628.1 hypothetical protein Lade_1286 [Legionella adelaidensis]VEH81039.1 Uncharacterised protein [Legionella adelaidensis]